jgi:hypothetical protein
VRRGPVGLLTMLAAAGVLAAGSLGDGPRVLCGRRLCLRHPLPASITLALSGTTIVIARDGSVRRRVASPRLEPPGAAVFPAAGSWYMFARGHLVIGRRAVTIWRSWNGGWSARHLGVVIVGRRMFAFQYAHRLYVGPVDGTARAVARREMPLGWNGERLYTNSYPRRALLLRGATGRLLKVVSRLPFHSAPVVAHGSVYLVLGDTLMRADGSRVQRLASLATLGMSQDSWLQPVGGPLELQDNRRMLILRANGSVFASTPLPQRDGEAGSLSASPVPGPDSDAAAFTVAYGQSVDRNAAAWVHGEETVYLLRSGARTAAPLHTEDVNFRVCERGAGLQWHGNWLLYTNSEGNVVLIDATGAHPAIDLTAAVAGLTGTRGAGVTWTSPGTVTASG